MEHLWIIWELTWKTLHKLLIFWKTFSMVSASLVLLIVHAHSGLSCNFPTIFIWRVMALKSVNRYENNMKYQHTCRRFWFSDLRWVRYCDPYSSEWSQRWLLALIWGLQVLSCFLTPPSPQELFINCSCIRNQSTYIDHLDDCQQHSSSCL